jgi:hypothetical protein
LIAWQLLGAPAAASVKGGADAPPPSAGMPLDAAARRARADHAIKVGKRPSLFVWYLP